METVEAEIMAEDRTDKQSFPRFWLFVILILGSVILGDLNQRMTDARGLEKDLEFLQTKSLLLDEEIIELEDRIEEVDSDDFIHDWAHEEAKMVKDNEVLVIFIPTGIEEDPDGLVSASETSSANEFEVWWELIFGR